MTKRYAKVELPDGSTTEILTKVKYRLEVVLTKRDPNALVREYRYTEDVQTVDIAKTTADALIVRLAVFDDDPFRRSTLTTRGGITRVYESSDGRIVGFANITEIH